MTNGVNDSEPPPWDRPLVKYKTLEDALDDGWRPVESLFQTQFVYCFKAGVLVSEQELIEPPAENT